MFLSRKAWIPINRSNVESKGGNKVPVKWVLKRKEETYGLIHFKQRNVVKGYMQVPRFDYTESVSLVATDTSTRIPIGLTLYNK